MSYYFFVLFYFVSVFSLCAQNRLNDALYGFENPQDSAKTKVWWFHGETQTTRQGITADLEAFRNAGIGGVVYYDQSHGKAADALPGFSDEWFEMLRFSALEAKRLGLSFEMNISNGFVAGGTWISKENAMKRLAATQCVISGGRFYEGRLQTPVNRNAYSRDIAVLAFPATGGKGRSSLNSRVRLSSNIPELKTEDMFVQPSQLRTVPIPQDSSSVYINIEFEEPFTARSLTYEMAPRGKATTSATNVPGPPQNSFVGTGYRIMPDIAVLEVSDNGTDYRTVCTVPTIYKAHESWRQKTVSFPAVRGRFFRLNISRWWEADERKPVLRLGGIIIDGAARTDQWEEKAGFFSEYILADRTPDYSPQECISSSQIINLTDKMDSDGVLHWQVPQGEWVVMRFASVLTGAKSKHGRKNLMGYECDKLSKKAALAQWQGYVGRILDSLNIDNCKVEGITMDSHEAGSQNWTDEFLSEFHKRRGYDLLPLLPAMMGYVVDNTKRSQSVLYDVRRNIADMIADNYYAVFDSLCSSCNMTFTAQATGNALCIVADPILAKSRVAKPQGEFWPIHPDGNYDIKECSSSAHLYGKRVASAEAFTDARYSHSMSDLKTLADYAYAFGINEFVVCASAYQPWLDKVPGNTGGGRHYCINRNNTWWKYSRPFWDYQTRCAFMMRQGRAVADVCVYLGENAPVKILTCRLPDLPAGYDFDAFTSDALLRRFTVEHNRITTPDGNVSYKVMILPQTGEMTMSALRKVIDMLKSGICVYGSAPKFSPTLQDEGCISEFDDLVSEVWGKDISGIRHIGKGTLCWGIPLDQALMKMNISPDLQKSEGEIRKDRIYFAHRRLDDAEVYFIANRKDVPENDLFTFSASYPYAQLWNPVTGRRYSLDIVAGDDNFTSINLAFAPRESFFVVLSDKPADLPVINNMADISDTINLDSDWKVDFNNGKQGSSTQMLSRLVDWTQSSDSLIRYYSGTAVYSKKFALDNISGAYRLELEVLNGAAEVYVNSHKVQILWCSPWSVDITPYLTSGENEIIINVVNSLTNRMIYDESLPLEQRQTYSFPAIVKKGDQPVPSGLVDVKLLRIR